MKRWIDILLDLFLAVVGLALLWIFAQIFLFASFHIPSDSMEPELVEGDFVVVWKPMLGARLFNLNMTLRLEQVEIHRVPGFRNIKRDDVLVFNFPYPNNWDRIEMHILKYYFKRCIGLPGDTLFIKKGRFRVEGIDEPLGNIKSQQKIGQTLPEEFPGGVYRCFPYDSIIGWNIQNFGPLYIPKTGDRLPMNLKNYQLYHKLISWEQKAKLEYKDSTVFLNDKPIKD